LRALTATIAEGYPSRPSDGSGKADKKVANARTTIERQRAFSEVHFPSVALDEFRPAICRSDDFKFPFRSSFVFPPRRNGREKLNYAIGPRIFYTRYRHSPDDKRCIRYGSFRCYKITRLSTLFLYY